MPEVLDLHSKTSKALRSLSEAAMQRYGLHLGQNHLLAALWERDGLTPGEVAAALRVATPTVVKMATRMAATGLITRRHDHRDNRLVRLWLTDKGRALKMPIEAERRLIEERITSTLTEAEHRCLISTLEKIHHEASAMLKEAIGRSESAAI